MDTKALAIDIVRKLSEAGYIAYFAGGWVRDFLLGHPSEDIDIATDAPPEKIMDLFPRTILVGLAFGVVIVVVAGHQFEVATFRRDVDYVDGRRPNHIELSTAREDAYRRDFTINGMFYDPIEEVIHDFVQGYDDLKKGIIRAIGDPYQRFIEDRLRMIRAIRFAARFSFTIEPETEQAILENASTLFPAVAMERVWLEFNKIARYHHLDWALLEMHKLSLLPEIFPELRGLHLKDLRHRLDICHHFPSEVPTILSIMELFPSQRIEEKEEICRRLRISKQEIELVTFVNSIRKITDNNTTMEDVEWAHLYADQDSEICLGVIAARMEPPIREQFLQQHACKRVTLEPYIERIRKKKPLVTAMLLKSEGIVPGKQMGVLLKEAERFAVNHQCQDPQRIVDHLRTSPLWDGL
jgi:poly(A) polymerase